MIEIIDIKGHPTNKTTSYNPCIIDLWIRHLTVHSPLLSKSHLVLIPLPINMFKFGRFSYMKLSQTLTSTSKSSSTSTSTYISISWKNPNLQKNDDYPIWTTIPNFWTSNRIFFHLKRWRHKKWIRGTFISPELHLTKIWEKSENLFFDQKTPNFWKLKLDFFPIQKFFRRCSKFPHIYITWTSSEKILSEIEEHFWDPPIHHPSIIHPSPITHHPSPIHPSVKLKKYWCLKWADTATKLKSKKHFLGEK